MNRLAELTIPTPSPLDVCADGALTIPAAVAFSGIGRTTLYALMGSGRLASVRVGDRRLIPRRALVAYLAENLVTAEVTE